MNHHEIRYRPIAFVSFTFAEVESLFNAAAHHYDGHCRSYAHANGPKPGLLTGLLKMTKNGFGKDGHVETELSWRQLDTLCKIGESPYVSIELYRSLGSCLAALRTHALPAVELAQEIPHG